MSDYTVPPTPDIPITARTQLALALGWWARPAAVLQGCRPRCGKRFTLRLPGAPPADRDALATALVGVSKLVETHPEIHELDLNPVFAYPDGALAVDARIVVAED